MPPTPYYDEGGITIYHGRCEDVLPSLEPVDLIFTSPPYNLGGAPGDLTPSGQRPTGGHGKWKEGCDGTGVGYADHEDAMPWPAYVAWQHAVLRLCWDRLSPTGAIFYNHKPRVIDNTLWLPLELNPGLPLRQVIVWARAGGVNFNLTAYVPTHEWIMVMARDAFRLRSRAASGVGDVWRVPQEPSAHPAPFPVGLPARAIETAAPSVVLDPFMGSGSALRAAANAGVRAIGIERSERYCEMAAKRLDQQVLAFG